MDFKQLTYFITVVNEGTISAAAKKLHMTQPPLSTQLKLLEDEVGCLLFERLPRSIRLTEAGRIMYDRASNLLRMSSLMQDELKEYSRTFHQTLHLGVVSSVSSTLFCRWFREFHNAYPHIRFEISEANTFQLLEKLRDGLIELALVRTPFPMGDFHCVPLKKEAIAAVGHKSFFHTRAPGTVSPACPKISLEELSHMPLILYRRWEPLLAEVFQNAGLEFSPFCKNDDARTTAFLADAGLGIGILPESALPLLKNPDIIRKVIDNDQLTSQIVLIRNKNTHPSALAKIFTEYIA